MNKQSGFTLIELVIVIIILGILAATAVPKFVDLQGDARASALQGVAAALESGATLTYSQAAIEGIEKAAADTVTDSSVTIVYGYPDATSSGIEGAVDLSTGDWTWVHGTGVSTVNISGSTATDCQVTYTQAAEGERPDVAIDDTGC